MGKEFFRSMEIEPLADRILVERPPLLKSGSIIIPDQAQRRHASLRCTVKAVGKGCELGLQRGEQVIISPYGGKWLDEAGNPVEAPENAVLFVLSEEDVIARIK